MVGWLHWEQDQRPEILVDAQPTVSNQQARVAMALPPSAEQLGPEQLEVVRIGPLPLIQESVDVQMLLQRLVHHPAHTGIL